MARYKHYDLNQTKMIPLSYADQIVEGSFEYALNEIVEEHLDLSVFEHRYHNDATGRSAYDPKVLLKVVLYGYYRGIISSRRIAEACRRNVVFMALSADSRPHFTTLAAFVSNLEHEITSLFGDVLLYASELGLIGKEHFAIDGCKLPCVTCDRNVSAILIEQFNANSRSSSTKKALHRSDAASATKLRSACDGNSIHPLGENSTVAAWAPSNRYSPTFRTRECEDSHFEVKRK